MAAAQPLDRERIPPEMVCIHIGDFERGERASCAATSQTSAL